MESIGPKILKAILKEQQRRFKLSDFKMSHEATAISTA